MKEKQKQLQRFILAAALLLVFLTGADAVHRFRAEKTAKTGDVPITASVFSLDTFCRITVYRGGGEAALAAATERLDAFEALFDQSRESSDIYRINHRESGRVEISEDTARMLSDAQRFSAATGGAFDVTLGELTALWDVRNRTHVPEEAEIREALSARDPEGYRIEQADGGWRFVTENTRLQIDIGAIAKGYIADRLRENLLANGVESAVINLGGNVLCVGNSPDGAPFAVGVRKPEKDSAEELFRLSAGERSVVTAGIYERYFEENGVQYHHILSPEDGWPVQNELAAVTVVGSASELCDALSTTLLIKGTKEGLRFLAEYNRNNAEDAPYLAYFLKRDGSAPVFSEGAEELLLPKP